MRRLNNGTRRDAARWLAMAARGFHWVKKKTLVSPRHGGSARRRVGFGDLAASRPPEVADHWLHSLCASVNACVVSSL